MCVKVVLGLSKNVVSWASPPETMNEVWGGVPEAAFGLMGSIYSTNHTLYLPLLPLTIQWQEKSGRRGVVDGSYLPLSPFLCSFIYLANIY